MIKCCLILRQRLLMCFWTSESTEHLTVFVQTNDSIPQRHEFSCIVLVKLLSPTTSHTKHSVICKKTRPHVLNPESQKTTDKWRELFYYGHEQEYCCSRFRICICTCVWVCTGEKLRVASIIQWIRLPDTATRCVCVSMFVCAVHVRGSPRTRTTRPNACLRFSHRTLRLLVDGHKSNFCCQW